MFFSKLSLKAKLILVIWMVSFTALVLGFSFIIARSVQNNRQNLLNNIELHTSLVGESSAAALSFEEYIGVREVLSKLQMVPDVKQGSVYTAQGGLFAYYNARVAPPPPGKVAETEYSIFSDSTLTILKPISYNGTKIGWIRVVASTLSMKQALSRDLETMALMMVVLMLMAYLLASWLQHFISRPIVALTKVTEQISQREDYSLRLPTSGTDEIGSLYNSFNRMLDAIEHRETERNLARDELEQSENKYRSFIESSNDAIYLMYNDRLELVNQQFLEMFEIDRSVLSKPDFNFLKLIDEESKLMLQERQKKLERGEKVDSRYEFTGHTSSGRKLNLEVNVSYIPYNGGQAVQGFLRDITERRQLEDQLRQAQKMEAVGRLSGGVAHDFNNLLTIIMGYCELAAARLNDEHPVQRSIEQISKAGQRAEALTRQLLAFSRRQVIQPVIIDLNQMIMDLDKMLRRLIGEDIELVTLLDEQAGKIKADPGQLEQIILNLAVNSRDAMPEGGKLTLQTGYLDVGEKVTETTADIAPGRYAILTVSDNGVGMSNEVLEQIFEPFFTTKERGKGTGLGLSTVYGIVQQNEGYIKVESTPAKGTNFKIFLPSLAGAETIERAPAIEDVQVAGHEAILIVEDVEGLRNLASTTLSENGYAVQSASNGHDALQIFEEAGQQFDLLLTDVIMPGMNGKRLAEILTQKNPGLIVLYMSGYTEDIMVNPDELPDRFAFLQKPFKPTTLLHKVRSVLDKAKSIVNE